VRASSLEDGAAYGRSRGPTWLHTSSRLRLPDSPLLIIAVIFGALVLGYLLFTRASLDFRIYLIWALAVAALSLALVLKYASTRRAFWLVVAIGLMLKLFGSVARYEIIFRAYEGSSDAPGYYERGLTLARDLWQFDLNSLFRRIPFLKMDGCPDDPFDGRKGT
jgi:lysylphosphatidylglycerol synthetase-like protein (DUF2156 family)